MYFRKSILELNEIIDTLNGIEDENFENLYNFVKNAFNYRSELIFEFNF